MHLHYSFLFIFYFLTQFYYGSQDRLFVVCSGDSSLRDASSLVWESFRTFLEDVVAGGVGGTNPGGKKSDLGAGPGEGAPPYCVPYCSRVVLIIK